MEERSIEDAKIINEQKTEILEKENEVKRIEEKNLVLEASLKETKGKIIC